MEVNNYINNELPLVTALIPVFNEEDTIASRIENLLAQRYPKNKLQVIVISDGSTDNTENIVARYKNNGVVLLQTAGRVGKSLAQNQAVKSASGDILLLTDSAVYMEPDCLKELVVPFFDDNVGCTTAKLLFRSDISSDTAQAQGYYWNYELKLRQLETQLGLLATAAGPAMAIRKSLWCDLEPQFGDDCVLPLDVVMQGKMVMQVQEAIAWDENFKSFKNEYRARIRMTVRNWTGTVSRGDLLKPWRYPGYAFALWSHKMLRWLSPVFILLLGVSVFLLWLTYGAIWPMLLFLIFIILGVIGVIFMSLGVQVPVLSVLASFLVANAGFAMGLRDIMAGKLIRVYSNK